MIGRTPASGVAPRCIAITQWLVAVLLAGATAGCTGDPPPPVQVRVLPSGYEVGGERFELATPAVDKVVNAKPGRVRMLVCTNAPAQKTVQLKVELDARLQVPMELELTGSNCSL